MQFLNLMTPIFRGENFKKIFDSVPKEPEIYWVLVKTPSVKIDFSEAEQTQFFHNQMRVIDLPMVEHAHNVHRKVNAAIAAFKPGFLFGLDDDTIFCENAYHVFKKYGHDYKFIMGQQKLKNGSIRPSITPTRNVTDGAQAIIHTSLIKKPFESFANSGCADTDFVLNCWEAAAESERMCFQEVTTYYNFLNPNK